MDLGRATRSYLDWLIATRTVSEHTVRAYGGDLAALSNQLGLGISVKSLSADKLVGFVTAQRNRGMAAATVQRRASAVRGFCGWLQQTGQIAHNPWQDADLRIRRPKHLPRPARDESIRRLLAWLCRSAEVSRTSTPAGPFNLPYQANTLVAVALMRRG